MAVIGQQPHTLPLCLRRNRWKHPSTGYFAHLLFDTTEVWRSRLSLQKQSLLLLSHALVVSLIWLTVEVSDPHPTSRSGGLELCPGIISFSHIAIGSHYHLIFLSPEKYPEIYPIKEQDPASAPALASRSVASLHVRSPDRILTSGGLRFGPGVLPRRYRALERLFCLARGCHVPTSVGQMLVWDHLPDAPDK